MNGVLQPEVILLPHHRRMRRRGLGIEVNSPTTNAAEGAAVSTATAIGSAAGGPLGGAIAGAIAQVGVLIADLWSGCGNTCTEATSFANQTGDLLTQNLQAYLSAPVHYESLQTAALANFNTAWNLLLNGCSNPALGSAGQNCISQRQDGSCTYKTTPGGWQQQGGTWTYVYPGANGSGDTCWNYFVAFYDPIANDPTVVPDPIPGASVISDVLGSTGVTSLLSDVGLSPSSTLFGLPVADVIAAGIALLLLAVAL